MRSTSPRPDAHQTPFAFPGEDIAGVRDAIDFIAELRSASDRGVADRAGASSSSAAA
jgi:hypothetical protein